MAQTPPPLPTGTAAAPFTVGNAVSYGWHAFRKNARVMLLIALVVFAVRPATSLVDLLIGNQSASMPLQLVGEVVVLFFGLGTVRATLAVTRGEEPQVWMLFVTDRFGTYLVAMSLFMLGMIVTVGASVLVTAWIGSGVVVAGAASAVILSVAITTILIFYSFFEWVILDQSDSSPVQALKQSARLVSGHFWRVLGLFGVGLLISVPGLALSGLGLLATRNLDSGALEITVRALSRVGLLFTYGITAIASTYAYRALSGQPVAPVR